MSRGKDLEDSLPPASEGSTPEGYSAQEMLD